jgi:hypothetical protein
MTSEQQIVTTYSYLHRNVKTSCKALFTRQGTRRSIKTFTSPATCTSLFGSLPYDASIAVPQRLLHRGQCSNYSLNFQYPLISLRPSSSCLRLLPYLPITAILPSTFLSITCFRRQFLRKMWPVQSAFLLFTKTLITNKCTKRVLSSIVTHSYMFRPCWVIFRENFCCRYTKVALYTWVRMCCWLCTAFFWRREICVCYDWR